MQVCQTASNVRGVETDLHALPPNITSLLYYTSNFRLPILPMPSVCSPAPPAPDTHPWLSGVGPAGSTVPQSHFPSLRCLHLYFLKYQELKCGHFYLPTGGRTRSLFNVIAHTAHTALTTMPAVIKGTFHQPLPNARSRSCAEKRRIYSSPPNSCSPRADRPTKTSIHTKTVQRVAAIVGKTN